MPCNGCARKPRAKEPCNRTTSKRSIPRPEGGNTYIEIQPASSEVVYIPQYDPAAVWGPPEIIRIRRYIIHAPARCSRPARSLSV